MCTHKWSWRPLVKMHVLRMNRDMFSDNIDSYKDAIENIWDSVVNISIKMIDECKDDLNNIANGRFRID